MSHVIASPSVRQLAAQKGIDLEALAAKIGRTTIGREDLEANASSGAAPSAAPSAAHGQYWDVDHAQYGPVHTEATTRFDQIASANLGAANAMIPQVTHHDRANIEALEAFRASLKSEGQERGVRLTALAFHVKAVAKTLGAFPRFNTSLSSDGKTLTYKDYVHIGVAVDTPHGLMVPVIRDADQKGLWEIASEITDLAKRAQERKLRPEDMGGASMSISSLGGIGGSAFTPIVNPPEVAILGITRTQIETVWDGDTPRPAPMLPLDLSYDHRVINGADAARFMAHLCKILSDPQHMLL